MEKRLILTIALSLSVLLLWSALVSKPHQAANKEVRTQGLPPASPVVTEAPAKAIEQGPGPAELFKYSRDKVEVTFIEPQAAIKEIIFKAHQDHRFSLRAGLLLDDKTLVFKKESSLGDSVTFVYRDPAKKITKKFTFPNSNYTIELEINIQNLSGQPWQVNLPLVLGALDISPQNPEARFQDIAVASEDKIVHLAPRKEATFSQVKFLALREKYFTAILEPLQNNYTAFVRKINVQTFATGLNPRDIVLAPGQQIGQKYLIYLGPQDLRIINSIKPAWSAVINYGTFDFISQILLQALEFFYRLVHSWGWAIVILSLAVYLLLYPLTLKQMRSMKEMQALQPRVEELRLAYKDNPQKMNKEVMELYREHKVNPLGGCLPLLLQMPIFFALYQALMRSVALKGASFLWIKDLSQPDRLFLLPISLPVLGNEINILPLAMVVGMFIQQKLTMATTGSTAAEQQKFMLIFFPLLFGLIFYHMPSGLVLYWFINSTLTLLYQVRVRQAK